MIANTAKSSDFDKAVRYLLDPAKEHTMLAKAKKCWGNNVIDIVSEFKEVAKVRPKVQFPVRHFTIALTPDDKKVNNDTKSEIVIRIMDEMGYSDCQYFAVTHHSIKSNYEYIHIVANAITVTGDRVSDFKDYHRLELCLQNIKQDYKL